MPKPLAVCRAFEHLRRARESNDVLREVSVVCGTKAIGQLNGQELLSGGQWCLNGKAMRLLLGGQAVGQRSPSEWEGVQERSSARPVHYHCHKSILFPQAVRVDNISMSNINLYDHDCLEIHSQDTAGQVYPCQMRSAE